MRETPGTLPATSPLLYHPATQTAATAAGAEWQRNYLQRQRFSATSGDEGLIQPEVFSKTLLSHHDVLAGMFGEKILTPASAQ